jgi:putative membrane protein
MQSKIDVATRALRVNPNKALAIGRTVLANDRTLLSFVRTGLALLGGGVGLAEYVEDPLLSGAGYVLIVAGGFFLIAGTRRYLKVNQLLTDFGVEVSKPVE